MLLTIDEAADLLRTSRRAIYAMIARRQLPGVVRIRRRVLVRTADLLDWLRQTEDAIRLLDGREFGALSVEKFGDILDTRNASTGSTCERGT